MAADLQTLDARRRRVQGRRTPLPGDARRPEVEAELGDLHVPLLGVALHVGVEHDVQGPSTFRPGELEPERAHRSLDAGRALASWHRRAELRLEVRIQSARLEADVLGDEGGQRREVDGLHLESDLLRRGHQGGRKRRGVQPELEVLLLGEHGRGHHHVQRLAGAQVLERHVEVLDRQLPLRASRPIDQRDAGVAQRGVVDAQIGEVALLLLLGRLLCLGLLLRLGIGELLLQAVQVGGAVVEPDQVHVQPIHFGGTDEHVLAAGSDRAEERGTHVDALHLRERNAFASRGADAHVTDRNPEAGEHLGGDRPDGHRPAELLRQLRRLVVRLAGEDGVEHEQPDDDHQDQRAENGADDDRPFPLCRRIHGRQSYVRLLALSGDPRRERSREHSRGACAQPCACVRRDPAS